MRIRLIVFIVLIFGAALVLAACGSRQESPTLAEQLNGETSSEIAQVNSGEAAEADHEDGGDHAANEHEEEADHEMSEQVEADHEEGDDHAADEHEEEAAHEEGDGHAADEHAADAHNEAGEGHGAAAHGVPADAAAAPNPVAADAASVSAGEAIYTASCAVCHGATGLGDGAAGAALDPRPANLHEDHVQVLTDGALFYTIHNGVEGTGMPPWGETLSEDDIWNVVNFIRTFKE